jgi:hypothetical protein
MTIAEQFEKSLRLVLQKSGELQSAIDEAKKLLASKSVLRALVLTKNITFCEDANEQINK